MNISARKKNIVGIVLLLIFLSLVLVTATDIISHLYRLNNIEISTSGSGSAVDIYRLSSSVQIADDNYSTVTQHTFTKKDGRGEVSIIHTYHKLSWYDEYIISDDNPLIAEQ